MIALEAKKEIRSIYHCIYFIVEEKDSGEGVYCAEERDEGLYGGLFVLRFSVVFLLVYSRCGELFGLRGCF
jgi:hypothetical protein